MKSAADPLESSREESDPQDTERVRDLIDQNDRLLKLHKKEKAMRRKDNIEN